MSPHRITTYYISVCLLIFQPFKTLAEPLVFLSDPFCPYICNNQPGQQGYAGEVLREIYQQQGFDFQLKFTPWSRAKSYFAKSYEGPVKYNALVLTDSKISPHTVLNPTPIVSAQSCFFKRRGFNWQYQGVNSQPVRLGVMQDYGPYPQFEELFKRMAPLPIHNIVSSEPSKNSLQRLLGKRFDVAILDRSVGLYLIHQYGWQDQIELAGCGDTVRQLYIGFAAYDPKHPILIKLLEQGLIQLARSGRLAYWQHKYHIAHNAK